MQARHPRTAPSLHARFAALLLCLLTAVAAPAAEPPADRDPPPVSIGRPSGLEPPDQAAMAAWHRRYAPLARPVKKALGEVLEIRGRRSPDRTVRHTFAEMARPCRALGSAVAELRRRGAEHKVFPVADSAVDLHLKRLYLRLGDVAAACAGGRWAETEERLRQAGLAYRQAELALERWGLAP